MSQKNPMKFHKQPIRQFQQKKHPTPHRLGGTLGLNHPAAVEQGSRDPFGPGP